MNKRIESKLSDGTFYPSIPSLCLCSCNEIVYNGNKYILGHNSPPNKGDHKIKLSDGSWYPCIPSICECQDLNCREIVYNGAKFVNGHWSKLFSPLKGKNNFGEFNSFYGKKHKLESREKMRKSSPHLSGKDSPSYGIIPKPYKFYWYNSPFQGVIKLRGSYEPKYAFYLKRNNISWYYEYVKFEVVINGKETTYTPDFYLPESDEYIEVKGYFRGDAKEKFEAFKIQYPDIKIKLLMKKELKNLGIKI